MVASSHPSFASLRVRRLIYGVLWLAARSATDLQVSGPTRHRRPVVRFYRPGSVCQSIVIVCVRMYGTPPRPKTVASDLALQRSGSRLQAGSSGPDRAWSFGS